MKCYCEVQFLSFFGSISHQASLLRIKLQLRNYFFFVLVCEIRPLKLFEMFAWLFLVTSNNSSINEASGLCLCIR